MGAGNHRTKRNSRGHKSAQYAVSYASDLIQNNYQLKFAKLARLKIYETASLCDRYAVFVYNGLQNLASPGSCIARRFRSINFRSRIGKE